MFATDYLSKYHQTNENNIVMMSWFHGNINYFGFPVQMAGIIGLCEALTKLYNLLCSRILDFTVYFDLIKEYLCKVS